MRELSLHLLDLLENAVTAGASLVVVEIALEPEWNLLRITVEDNGPGLSVSPEQATNPFYTTKKGKKTGLGLSLFRFRIEQAGGELALERSPLGGLAVRATIGLSHIDRNPVGDLASTISSVLAANPELKLSLCIRVNGREQTITSSDVARELIAPDDLVFSEKTLSNLSIARRMYLKIKAGLAALQIEE